MTATEALEIVEQLLLPTPITPIQAIIFQRSWAGEEYAAIAKDLGYGYGYVRDTGAQLWRSLSQSLGEPVKKKNFRSLIQQRFGDRVERKGNRSVLGEALPLEIPEYPGSPVPLQSRFYIERVPVETKAFQELRRQGSLIHIKAPRKLGKSSLLIRLLQHATDLGYAAASIDFKQADAGIFSSLTVFLRWLCTTITLQLGLEVQLDQYWDQTAGSKVSCTLYLSRYLLPQLQAPLALALNEFDEILEYPILCREFLALLQSWHESAKQVEALQKLRLVLAYSMDICVPLKLSHSPFNNSGLPIELPELRPVQVQQLAQQYGLNWDELEVQRLMSLTSGHPYLVQLALYHLWAKEVTLEQLLHNPIAPFSIYRQHLQSYLAVLWASPNLALAFKQILQTSRGTYRGTTIDPLLIAQLESLGLIKVEQTMIMASCYLYQQYFSIQLAAVA